METNGCDTVGRVRLLTLTPPVSLGGRRVFSKPFFLTPTHPYVVSKVQKLTSF